MDNLQKHERKNITDNKSLTVEHHTVYSTHPLHWHSFFEVEIILDGKGTTSVNGKSYNVPDYNVFLISSTDLHDFNVTETTHIINISFDRDMICDADIERIIFSNGKKSYSFSESELSRIVSASELLEYECECDGELKKELLHYVLTEIFRKDSPKKSSEISLERSRGLRDALVYIELHFRESITLSDVAARAGYSPAYFSELFRSATGKTFIEEITGLRLNHARTMLANGFSVSDACFSSGFGSLTNFLEVFKKNYGVSPCQYKKSTKK